MKIQRTLLLAGFLTGGATGTALAQGNLVINTGGHMRIQLHVPTESPDVDQTTPVTSGRVEIAPILMVPGLLGHFSLNDMSLSFAAFDIRRRPFGEHHFRAVGVHLRGAVPFVAGESPAGVYTFSIPPDFITFYGGALVEGDPRWDGLYAGEKRPTEDVTGRIDMNTNTFQARVVIDEEKELLPFITVGGPLTIILHGVFGPGPTGGPGLGMGGNDGGGR